MTTKPYDVLETVESSSRPGEFYEIRKSHRDGKTYCTCKGWIFKARKGDGICKHIADYIRRGAQVIVYKYEEFMELRRGEKLDATPAAEPKRAPKVNVNRGGIL